jgi:NADH-quinone oxidoreductase subunit H
MRTWIDAAKRALPPAGATAFIDLGVCAALGMMPFGQYLIAAKLDVGLLFVVAIAGLASTAVAASGSFTGRGLRAAAHVVWQHAPAAVALSSVVVVAGSLRVRDIVRAQGGWPWEWLSFRSPASLVALGLVLACARVAAPRPHPSRATNAWVAASVRAHGLVVAGLAAALFLGGWSLPGLSAAQQDSRPALEMAGAACFMVKVATVSVALSWWRWAVPPANHVAAARSTLLWQLPSAIATLVATAAWTWLEPSAAAQGFASGALTLICVVAIAALGDRLRQALASPTADGHLDAFL